MLDPGIITQGQVRPPSYLELQQQRLALQNGQSQQQQNALAVQAQQLGLQQQRQDIADQQGARTALQAQNVTDEQILAAAGPKIGGAIVKSRQDALKSRQEAAKLDQETQKLQAEKAAHEADYAGHLAYAVKQAGYTPQALQLAIQQAHSDGYEKQAQMLGQLAQQNPQAIPQVLDQAISRSPAQQKRMQEAAKDAQQERHQTTQEQQAAATLANTTSNQQAERVQADKRLGLEEIRTRIEAKRAQNEAQRLGLSVAEFQQKYGDATASASPQMLKVAQSIANGDLQMPSARSAGGQKMRELVMQVDPSFTDARYKSKQDFKTGKDANDIASITRVAGHLEQFAQNSEKLGFAPSLLSSVNTTGNVPLRKDVDAIAEEFGKLVKGNSLTQEQAAHAEHGLLSPIAGTRKAAIDEIKNLLGSQFEAKFQKYKTATGQELDPTAFFDKATQARLAKQGLMPSGSEQQAAPATGGANLQDLRKKYGY